MEAHDIDDIVTAMRAGRTFRVPFSTTLYPETHADENRLCARADGSFELTTSYREFAAGHGWSIEMHETEVWSEARVREALGYAVSLPEP